MNMNYIFELSITNFRGDVIAKKPLLRVEVVEISSPNIKFDGD